MSHTFLVTARFTLLTCMLSITSFVKLYAGGDQFEVYLNSKLVSKQLVVQGYNMLTMRLNKDNQNEAINILYRHYGEIGKSRVVYLKDEKGNIIRQWNFTDNSGKVMQVPVKEIINTKPTNITLTLSYSSKDMKGECTLVKINLADKRTTSVPLIDQYAPQSYMYTKIDRYLL